MTAGPIPVVALVGDHLRHRWFAWQLAEEPAIDLQALVSERQRAPKAGESEEENRVIAEHFEARRQAEERYFGEARPWQAIAPAFLQVERGGSNELSTAVWVRRAAPAYLVLYGCSILREPLLAEWDARTVNMHLGLSPYYKGHATNFWPLVNGEPECVGATIHLATLDVDAGPILRQVRPDPAGEDGSHDLGCKTIASGARALARSLADLANGAIEGKAQEPGGRVYRHADFTAAAVLELRRRFAEGMIPTYLADKARRDARYPIVE